MHDRHASDLEPLHQAVDHVRGPTGAPLILEYGDYERPYSRAAYRNIRRIEAEVSSEVRFAFRHFPLTEIHPRAPAASQAAETASAQHGFWEIHDLLSQNQAALEDDDLQSYAAERRFALTRFDSDRPGDRALERVRRDVRSGEASSQVLGTPALLIDGSFHEGFETLVEALRP